MRLGFTGVGRRPSVCCIMSCSNPPIVVLTPRKVHSGMREENEYSMSNNENATNYSISLVTFASLSTEALYHMSRYRLPI
jgi:hypothetical protein